MRASARILTLLLAFIFAIPNNIPDRIEAVEFIPSAYAQQTEGGCESKGDGWEWNEETRRCVVSDDTSKMGSRARACADIEDENARKACY